MVKAGKEEGRLGADQVVQPGTVSQEYLTSYAAGHTTNPLHAHLSTAGHLTHPPVHTRLKAVSTAPSRGKASLEACHRAPNSLSAGISC